MADEPRIIKIGKKKIILDPYQAALLDEKELQTITKEYKKMERDKKLSNTFSKFAKQQRVISILKKENKNIMTDLYVATGSSNLKKNAAMWKQILLLLNDYDKINAGIKSEGTIMNEIDYQIKRTRNYVNELQAKQITDHQFQARVLEGRKVVEKLENRLYSVNISFCTILEQNRQLREEIEHYLMERAYFNKLWERYISRLDYGKKIMLDLIEQATIAYDQREEWCRNLTALRSRAQADMFAHTTEMSALQRDIDHNRKMQAFLGIKNQKRVMYDLEEKLMEKRRQHKNKLLVQVRAFKALLEEIKEFTGEQELDSLANKYLFTEEENFSKFLYANELTSEMEEMSSKLNHYRNRVDVEKKHNDEFEGAQEKELNELNAQVVAATDSADNADKEYAKTSEKLALIMKGIDKIFKLCKCNNAPIMELLGNNTIITKYNALLYLDILEARVSHMVTMMYYKQRTKIKSQAHSIINTSLVKRPPIPLTSYQKSDSCPLCMETAFCSDIVEKLQKVLPKADVSIKLNNYLAIPDAIDLVHNVSECHLPKSRQIIQKRYQ